MKTIIINIKNMECEHCVKRISNALQAVIEDFEIKLASKTISFEGNADTRARVVAKLESIGYEII